MLKLRLCGKISSRRIGDHPVIKLPIDNTANRPPFPLPIRGAGLASLGACYGVTKFFSGPLRGSPSGALAMTAPLAAAAALYPALVSPAAAAGDYDVGSIHISQPWSRATPKGAAAGAGYMTLTNKGGTGEGQLRFRRRQRAMSDSPHDDGRRGDENAPRGRRLGNQAGRIGHS